MEDKITFVVYGNESDAFANPRPKLKMTGRQQWMPNAQRYQLWKDHVAFTFLKATAIGMKERHEEFVRNQIAGKPIQFGNEKASMDIMIYFGSKNHGDPENIFGSIADALFKQDKHLVGSFDYVYLAKGEQPHVKITLRIPKSK